MASFDVSCGEVSAGVLCETDSTVCVSCFGFGNTVRNAITPAVPKMLAIMPMTAMILEEDIIFFVSWSRWPDLNRRPTRYECVALPTELHRRNGGRKMENGE